MSKKVKIIRYVTRGALEDSSSILQTEREYSLRRSDILLYLINAGAILLIFQFIKEVGIINIQPYQLIIFCISGCLSVLSILIHFFGLRMYYIKTSLSREFIINILHTAHPERTEFELEDGDETNEKAQIKIWTKRSIIFYVISVVSMSISLIMLATIIIIYISKFIFVEA